METARPSPHSHPKSQEQLQGSDTGIREAEVEVCRGERSAEACFPKTATRWVFAILSSCLSPAVPCPGSLPCPYTLQVGLGACSSVPPAPFVSNAVMHRFILAPCSSWHPQCLAQFSKETLPEWKEGQVSHQRRQVHVSSSTFRALGRGWWLSGLCGESRKGRCENLLDAHQTLHGT